MQCSEVQHTEHLTQGACYANNNASLTSLKVSYPVFYTPPIFYLEYLNQSSNISLCLNPVQPSYDVHRVFSILLISCSRPTYSDHAVGRTRPSFNHQWIHHVMSEDLPSRTPSCSLSELPGAVPTPTFCLLAESLGRFDAPGARWAPSAHPAQWPLGSGQWASLRVLPAL